MSGTGDKPRRLGVVPFERDLIEDHLQRGGMHFQKDEDGDFVVQFTPHETHGFQLTMLFMAQGTNGEVYALRCVSNIRVPEEHIPAAVATCNNWATRSMMPTAFVVGENEDGAVNGSIVLQCHYPLAAGVTQPIIDEFTTSFVGSCFAFWEWFFTQAASDIQQAAAEAAGDASGADGAGNGDGYDGS